MDDGCIALIFGITTGFVLEYDTYLAFNTVLTGSALIAGIGCDGNNPFNVASTVAILL